MPGTSAKTRATTVRIPNALLERVDEYADENGLSRSAAIVGFVEAGMDAVESAHKPATRDDVAVLAAKLDALEANQRASAAAIVKAISEQPIAVQETPALPDPDVWKQKGLIDRILKR